MDTIRHNAVSRKARTKNFSIESSNIITAILFILPIIIIMLAILIFINLNKNNIKKIELINDALITKYINNNIKDCEILSSTWFTVDDSNNYFEIDGDIGDKNCYNEITLYDSNINMVYNISASHKPKEKIVIDNTNYKIYNKALEDYNNNFVTIKNTLCKYNANVDYIIKPYSIYNLNSNEDEKYIVLVYLSSIDALNNIIKEENLETNKFRYIFTNNVDDYALLSNNDYKLNDVFFSGKYKDTDYYNIEDTVDIDLSIKELINCIDKTMLNKYDIIETETDNDIVGVNDIWFVVLENVNGQIDKEVYSTSF